MQKLNELKQWLRDRAPGGIALAFSGGVDSALLLAVLRELREESSFQAAAITLRSIFQNPKEIEEAGRMADQCGIPLRIFEYDPLAIPELQYNPPDRCYWCKRHIFLEMKTYARESGFRSLIDGTNADDMKTRRPGLRALRELRIESPLAACGIGKADVRAIARDMRLAFADKPSSPCMATRYEYGSALTEDMIRRIVDAEDALRRILPEARDLRLRMHGGIARIEVSPDAMGAVVARHADVRDALRGFDFNFITLDLNGFSSGSMDFNTHDGED